MFRTCLHSLWASYTRSTVINPPLLRRLPFGQCLMPSMTYNAQEELFNNLNIISCPSTLRELWSFHMLAHLSLILPLLRRLPFGQGLMPSVTYNPQEELFNSLNIISCISTLRELWSFHIIERSLVPLRLDIFLFCMLFW